MGDRRVVRGAVEKDPFNQNRPHYAIDFDAYAHEPVYNVTDAYVYSTAPKNPVGMSLRTDPIDGNIDDGSFDIINYVHIIPNPDFHERDFVPRGALIGWVKDVTEASPQEFNYTRPMLHYEHKRIESNMRKYYLKPDTWKVYLKAMKDCW
jgi:hypothetical protein